MLPFLISIPTIALAMLWIAGEAMNKPWLRRIAGPLFLIVVAGIAVTASGIITSPESSFRYSGAIKEFVAAFVKISERDGDASVVGHLRRYDSISCQTYEGSTILEWLAEPVVTMQKVRENSEIQSIELSAADSKNLDSWVGVYATPRETIGGSGTVLLIGKVGDRFHYRRTYYTDVQFYSEIDEIEKFGIPLLDEGKLYLPMANGFSHEHGTQLSASVARYVQRKVNGRVVLISAEAERAFDQGDRLYTNGILIKTEVEPTLVLDLNTVAHESVSVLGL